MGMFLSLAVPNWNNEIDVLTDVLELYVWFVLMYDVLFVCIVCMLEMCRQAIDVIEWVIIGINNRWCIVCMLESYRQAILGWAVFFI